MQLKSTRREFVKRVGLAGLVTHLPLHLASTRASPKSSLLPSSTFALLNSRAMLIQ